MNRDETTRSLLRLCVGLTVTLVLTGCSRETGRTRDESPRRKSSTKTVTEQDDPKPEDDAPLPPEQPDEPIPIRRPSDYRPVHDDALLAAAGIHLYESTRLKLYTDIPPEDARELPGLVDQIYDAWVEYFGPLPPAEDESEFQMTGYLMDDAELFARQGLLPEDLPVFAHGRHRGAEFWMNNQVHAYYRRHLLLHEATHCYMTIVPHDRLPLWYHEGMAELFGTHRVDENGKATFRVMPHNREEFAGFGRITLIRDDIRRRSLRRIMEITEMRANAFYETEAYAWSWALCHFLDHHPRYSERFSRLAKNHNDPGFSERVHEAFADDLPEIRTEWPTFVARLQLGYDLPRAAISFASGRPLADHAEVHVEAAKGWQSSRVAVVAGKLYEIVAHGECVLATTSRPWTSQPAGVTLRYADGHPIGRLLAAVRPPRETIETNDESLLAVTPAGLKVRFRAERTGTLYLRINDFLNELDDNSGGYTVVVQEVAE